MRFGIVGTGFISHWFVEACRRAGGVPIAVCSRDAARGSAFAARHGLAAAVDSIAELVSSPAVDAVYVASPIAAHHDHIVAALSAGKDVLSEKTLTTSPQLVSELYELADRRSRVLLEAVRPSHDPAYTAIAAALPRLGEVRHAHFEKCQYSSRYPAYLRGEVENALDPASGNSALRDIGVYCIHPALFLFGTPEAVTGVSYRLPNGFEAGGDLLLRYDSLVVGCRYSKTTASISPSTILGEGGSLSIDSIAEPAQVTFTGIDGRVEHVLNGPAKQPQETLAHPIVTFQRLCADRLLDHPYRRASLTAERIFSQLLTHTSAPAWFAFDPDRATP